MAEVKVLVCAHKAVKLPVLEDQPSNRFFIRPRRFGKSLFISMMRAFNCDMLLYYVEEWHSNHYTPKENH